MQTIMNILIQLFYPTSKECLSVLINDFWIVSISLFKLFLSSSEFCLESWKCESEYSKSTLKSFGLFPVYQIKVFYHIIQHSIQSIVHHYYNRILIILFPILSIISQYLLKLQITRNLIIITNSISNSEIDHYFDSHLF